MNFTEAVARYTALLRENPAAPRPRFRAETAAELHESKMHERAFDQAQLDLGLVSPGQMQRLNSAVQVDRTTAQRVVRYPQYV